MISMARPKSTRVTRIHKSAKVTTSRTLVPRSLVMALSGFNARANQEWFITRCQLLAKQRYFGAFRRLIRPSFERKLGLMSPVAVNSDLLTDT